MGRRGLDGQALRMNASGRNYYLWLLDKIHIRDHPHHEMMVEYLYDYPYRWRVEDDRNRAVDGMELRDRFEMETGWPISEYKEVGLNVPCSVLEMLVGLAMRIEDDIMYDPEHGERTHIWFWMMAENLGLTKATDDEIEFGDRFGVPYLDYLLDSWMSGNVQKAEIFPQKVGKNHQKVEGIWQKTMNFLNFTLDKK